MNRTLGGLILALLSGPAVAQMAAPFCVYSSGPPQCFYFDVQSCQTAARSLGGMCGPNNQAPAPAQIRAQPVTPQIQHPDIAGSFQRGMAEGQRQRIEREEHQARMALLEAQAQAARSQTSEAIVPPTAQPERYVGVVSAPDDARTAKSLADGCAVANAILDGTADTKFGSNRQSERLITAGICYGYIEGFIQGISAGRQAPKSLNACIPTGVSTPQIARLIEDRMKKMPEFEHMDRMPFLMAVTAGAWPCKTP
ncbi:Rap1a/Tai family immunity protein [Lysobacter sp. CFH 32150]|uniref:Rap1a/Tai family immunity protein n=1 Tax=Lysobacter sp. CFH 32150 TaxID=2927128 RepID=UPI001FA739E2|nr:Rap1a/Tai family immunity protein [Lysobacter sp. CFH 32150]MCI4567568.1 hypothetical protein [Lysobacter sp. CFH 32150]